jgi:hypothetical protein
MLFHVYILLPRKAFLPEQGYWDRMLQRCVGWFTFSLDGMQCLYIVKSSSHTTAYWVLINGQVDCQHNGVSTDLVGVASLALVRLGSHFFDVFDC